MLKSSEFNSAVPKFTNGNYASSPLDPTNIEEPSAQDYVRGTEPLDTLPAQWWNWLCNQFTSRFNKLNTYVKNIFDELTGFLSLLNITPDGTESAITTGQLKNAFKEDYPSYINDKLELGTTYVKRTQKINNHALSGDITISKADVGLGNVANTGDSATPVSGGTTKFTTGGAYTELNKKADKVVNATNNDVATLDANGNLKDSGVPLTSLPSADNSKNAQYFLSKANRTGTTYWSIEVWHKTTSFLSGILTIIDRKGSEYKIALGGSDAALTPTVYRMDNRSRASFDAIIAFAYDATTIARDYCKIFVKSGAWDWDNICYVSAYENGDVITVQSDNERTTDGTDFNSATPLNIKDFATTDITSLKADLADLAPSFSTTTAYAVGDYVIYIGNLYRCTVAHSAGAWNASHFTAVTVGGELETKADKTSLALPTDAVLHYSFDEVPDYPDGTAVYKKDNDFTDTTGWAGSVTISTNNGKLHIQNTTTSSQVAYYNLNIPSNSIYVISGIANLDCTIKINVRHDFSSPDVILKVLTLAKGQHFKVIMAHASSAINFSISGTQFDIDISTIYIGNGSFSTPIIDNANGQFNATNNGGIATNGVSGKGAYFLNGKYAQVSNFNFTKDFTVSVWVKPDNANNNLYGNILFKPNVIYIRNGGSSNNYFLVAIYNPNSSDWQYITTTELLPINKYTHIVLVKNGTIIKLYFDTSLKRNSTIVDDVNTNNQPLYISNSNNARPQSIDDLLIFDRALTENEVMALYLNRGNTPKYYGEVPVTRKINGHTLEEDITLTKADVGLSNVADKDLSNVVNTGDSATPVSGGLTKFTTGGAYDFFAKKNNYNDWLETVFGWSMGTSWSKASFDKPSYIGYGNGVFVTIGYSGSIGYHFYWSTDGKTWTQGSTADGNLNSCYFNGNLFVSITDLHAYWSTDGKTWTQGSGTDFKMGISASSVYYANNIWVITGSDKHTYWSTDGKTWTIQNSNLNMYGSVVSYANGLWVIGGNALYWSTDGKTWTKGNGGGASTSVVYNNDIWVSVGKNPYWSTDGKTWTQGSGFSSSHGLCYGNGIWITLSGSNGYKSTDGKTWTSVSLGGSGGASVSIDFSNGIWIYSSLTNTGGQGVVTRSIDGENWERVTTGLSGSDHDFGRVICKNGIWIVTDAHYNAIYSSSYRSLLPNYGN